MNSILIKISIIIPIIFVIITYVIYMINRKDNKITIVKTSKLSDKINPLKMSYIYNGCITSNEVCEMIPYLANKGYIKISCKKKLKVNSLNTKRTI